MDRQANKFWKGSNKFCQKVKGKGFIFFQYDKTAGE